MKYQEILNLNQALSALNLSGVKFAYAVSKNLSLLKTEIKALQDAQKPSAEYVAYDKERIELCKKHAKKDEKGKPIFVNNSFDIEDREAFDADLKALQEAHKEAVEAREQQIKDFNDLLEKEVKLTLHKIKLSDVPEAITTKEMESIYEIIEE